MRKKKGRTYRAKASSDSKSKESDLTKQGLYCSRIADERDEEEAEAVALLLSDEEEVELLLSSRSDLEEEEVVSELAEEGGVGLAEAVVLLV
jgi:hypothetical protein